MSIQDDIFDVTSFIADHENKNTNSLDYYKKAFENICEWAFELEEERNHLSAQCKVLRSAINIVKNYESSY